MKKSLLAIALACLVAAALLVGPPSSGAWGGSQKFFQTENAVQGQYIVVLNSETEQSFVAATAESLAADYGGRVRFVYEYALKGFSVEMPEESALQLSEDARVEFVEENGAVSLATTQINPPWGLDRIDQRPRPLSATYTYDNIGGGVKAYVIDTGIRPTHVEFRPLGRAVAAADYAPTGGGNGDPPGCSNIPPILCGAGQTPQQTDTNENTDCNGHGTHVAGTIGGATYGVAKGVRLFGVRVLNCFGQGTWESVIAGVDWATGHHQTNPGPAVANMSLGGNAISSVDIAVRNSINSGITYVVAAGNNNANAANYSPARVSEALTVGATTINDVRGFISSGFFSNFGPLVDVHAPGVDVVSAWSTSDTATNTISGTSMASPHVAGVVALYLQTFPFATPPVVHAEIVNNATSGVVTSLPAGTPNRLVYSRFFPAAPRANYTDFDTDAQADFAVWRPVDPTFGSGVWHVRLTSDGTTSAVSWGQSGDRLVPGDYDGDRRADRAVWRPSNGIWYVIDSSTGAPRYPQWGADGDIPVPADYDGDGRTDLATWRPSNGIWNIIDSSIGLPRYESWGAGSLGDKPVAADYDGDGRADLAVWRPSEGNWYVRLSSTGASVVRGWGSASHNDVLVPADYDGDRRADFAVWRPGSGLWCIVDSSTGAERYDPWGLNGDIPVAADYDGDGKADIAVWRPSEGVWYIRRTSDGQVRYESWGANGDTPIPAAFNR